MSSTGGQNLRLGMVAEVRTSVTALAEKLGFTVCPAREGEPERREVGVAHAGVEILMIFRCPSCARRFFAARIVPDRVPDDVGAEMAIAFFRIALVHHLESDRAGVAS
jgi:hypothetical protein